MKRKPIRQRIQRMVLAISIAALILTSSAGIFSMIRIQSDSESALTHQMEQSLSNIADNKADLAEAELRQYTSYVQNFADYIHGLYSHPEAYTAHEVLPPRMENKGIYAMQRVLTDPSTDINGLMNEIKLLGSLEDVWSPVMKTNGDIFTSIYAGTKTGVMLAYDKNSHNAIPQDGKESYYNFFESEWYKTAESSNKVFFTDVYPDNYNMGLTITCSAPFYDAEGNFAGAVCMDILITDLYREIVDIDLGTDAYAFLVDRAGNIIAPGQDTESIYRNHDITNNIAEDILAGKTGVSRTDKRIYYAYKPITGTGWKFCVRIPERVILAPVRSVNRTVIYAILLFVAAFVLIIMLVVFTARRFSARLTYPILALGRDVREISSGDLDYRAEVRDNDEVGDLARSFNDMAASLKEYVNNLESVTAEKERISTELNLATQIQADMLPRIFPPFPDRKEFDIYATMTPAKEVGGDFYDFFMIDDDHLALVMADVSGKGVPAALFMVIAKTLIKNRAQMGGSPSAILHDVNRQLCEGNEADLFVTVWLGILEVSTGKVTASNAGHEYPAIRRSGGKYELLKARNSPAVAAMEGMRFNEHEFTLNPGDNLYLYTDGVAEATNSDEELYGTDRMLEALDRTKNDSSEEILASMKSEVDAFTGDAPQFDDITMLCLRYFGGADFVKELTIEADVNNLDEVLAFVDEQLEVHDCPPKTQMQLDVAVEELFVNIAHYAYNPETGNATVRVEIQENPLSVVITFIDRGVPYDPLAKDDPDVTLSAEDREIGGLGIYLVKKSMDAVNYEYKDGKNILAIKKNLG